MKKRLVLSTRTLPSSLKTWVTCFGRRVGSGEAERLIVASLEINRDLLGEGDPESIED